MAGIKCLRLIVLYSSLSIVSLYSSNEASLSQDEARKNTLQKRKDQDLSSGTSPAESTAQVTKKGRVEGYGDVSFTGNIISAETSTGLPQTGEPRFEISGIFPANAVHVAANSLVQGDDVGPLGPGPQVAQSITDEVRNELMRATQKLYNQNTEIPGWKNYLQNVVGSFVQTVTNFGTPPLIHYSAQSTQNNSLGIMNDNYQLFIQRKDYVGLLTTVQNATNAEIEKRRKVVEECKKRFLNENAPAVGVLEQYIEEFRKHLSYGKSSEDLSKMNDIESLYKFFLDNKAAIEHNCSNLRSSILYQPTESQSLFDGFIGAVFLPQQLDLLFEPHISICLRSRGHFLLSLAALHNNLLALHYAKKLFKHSDEDDTSSDETSEKIATRFQQALHGKGMHELSGSSFYAGALCRAKLEKSNSLEYFERSQAQNDPRGMFESLRTTPNEELLSRLIHANPGLGYLAKALKENNPFPKNQAYIFSATNGAAYSYVCLGHANKENNKDDALEYFCKAFVAGHYDIFDEIIKLCKPSHEELERFTVLKESIKQDYLSQGLSVDSFNVLKAKF